MPRSLMDETELSLLLFNIYAISKLYMLKRPVYSLNKTS